ncbi:glycosyltransferase family 4 protein [Bizionia sp.]|uniref:glycosyltransferase family 4 protein n=1 Tax=Bizionia sp. TaxID=1954480 RepID=UPI003A920E2E
MSSKKVVIWTSGIDNLINGEGLVGGLTVQMMHWANTFLKNDWEVISLTNNKTKNGLVLSNIIFKYLRKNAYLNIVFEPFIIFYFLYKNKPELLISRGASRTQFALMLATKTLGVKLVLMLASDTDVLKGKELIRHPWDRILFRLGLRNTKYIIAQNSKQEDLVRSLRGNKNKVIVIPNVWPVKEIANTYKSNSILWVSNFRELKRPNWFLELAKELPEYNFAMVGKSLDNKLFEQCKERALKLPNVRFLGGLSFVETDGLFSQHKLFVCTSEIEGFPNTFLQAWANQVPVITSFDPSDVVENENLGITFETIEEARLAIQTILGDKAKYADMQNAIKKYFKTAHHSQKQYERLIGMTQE